MGSRAVKTRSGMAGVLVGVWLAVAAGGCALIDAPGADFGNAGKGGSADAWLGYFAGDDLRASCEAGVPDRFRVVTHADGRDGLQSLEVIENPAGGALMVYRWVGVADLAHNEPSESWLKHETHVVLSPRDFEAVLYWLDRLGLLSPGMGAPPGPDGEVVWLISGCLDGSWFQNGYQPSGSGDGMGIDIRNAIPGPPVHSFGRGLLNDPVPDPLRPEAGFRSGLPSATPAATPTANRAGLARGP